MKPRDPGINRAAFRQARTRASKNGCGMSKSAANRSKQAPPEPSRFPAVATGAVIALAIVVVVLWMFRGAFAPQAAAPAASTPAASGVGGAPLLGTHYPSQGHAHLDPGQADTFAYNSNPPTSGPHKELFSDQFVNPTPLPAYIQVHLLEHGNVLLQYSCACPDVAASLASLAYVYDSKLIAPNELQPTAAEVQQGEDEGRAVIVAPYPDMHARIALTAWTRLATLQTVDKAKIDSFVSQYLGNVANASQ
jgi:hypothetical protein